VVFREGTPRFELEEEPQRGRDIPPPAGGAPLRGSGRMRQAPVMPHFSVSEGAVPARPRAAQRDLGRQVGEAVVERRRRAPQRETRFEGGIRAPSRTSGQPQFAADLHPNFPQAVTVVGAAPEGIRGKRGEPEGQLRTFRDPTSELEGEAEILPLAEVAQPRLQA
jgi:hypothetical protein